MEERKGCLCIHCIKRRFVAGSGLYGVDGLGQRESGWLVPAVGKYHTLFFLGDMASLHCRVLPGDKKPSLAGNCGVCKHSLLVTRTPMRFITSCAESSIVQLLLSSKKRNQVPAIPTPWFSISPGSDDPDRSSKLQTRQFTSLQTTTPSATSTNPLSQ